LRHYWGDLKMKSSPLPNFVKLVLSPVGRIGRRDYLIGLVGLVVIFTLHGLLIKVLGQSMMGLFAVLAFPFVILQVAFSVYGKRLHDIGRTLWPVTALLALMVAAMIVVMLVYGGAEYFATYGEYTRDNQAPAEVSEALNAEFKAQQEQAVSILSWVIMGLLTTFTLWLALAKSQAVSNQYGDPS